MKRCCVAWRSKLTGHFGFGSPMPADVVDATVAECNRSFPYIEHWAESEADAADLAQRIARHGGGPAAAHFPALVS